MNKILIIDDEPGIRNVLSDILEDEGYRVLTAEDGIKGLDLLENETIDLVILDIWLPNMGGMDVLKELKNDHPDIEVIIISGHANIDLAVKAVKLGAFDFLEKPLSLEKVITLVRNALEIEKLKQENRSLKNTLFVDDEMIGASAPMKKIEEIIAQSAKSDSRILITGANGTGKELVARELHRKSNRAANQFIEVNCAAIPDTLIESELFGHEKGAFTSAVSRRLGKFELSHRGTIFLDEVADMSLSAQAKVLRVIQDLKFERIGGEESIEVDVRIIAATNKDIHREIASGNFREDLFFRLNVIPIHVPALTDRQDDLPLLIDYFMIKFKNPLNEKPKTISANGMRKLIKYKWPGNIRELKNFIERINIMSDEQVIDEKLVKAHLGEKQPEARESFLDKFVSMKLNEAKGEFEKQFIHRKLQENQYNISKTAEVLGVYPSNLHGKIKKFGIEIIK
jgi:two-component system, NtrC family, nitrogen regulation response regulator NtrX